MLLIVEHVASSQFTFIARKGIVDSKVGPHSGEDCSKLSIEHTLRGHASPVLLSSGMLVVWSDSAHGPENFSVLVLLIF